MAAVPRTIHLRRPPVIAMQEGVYVPNVRAGVLLEVERRWRALRDLNPAAFDGHICHVLGVHRNGHGGATIHTIDCAYRYYAVQEEGFDLGVRPLGVKGIVRWEDSVLIGVRSKTVRWYAGLREFAPGGMVEPGAEPTAALERELAEETGLTCASAPAAIAILYDEVARTWEVMYRIRPASDRLACSSEHESIEWTHADSIAETEDMSPISRRIASLLIGMPSA